MDFNGLAATDFGASLRQLAFLRLFIQAFLFGTTHARQAQANRQPQAE